MPNQEFDIELVEKYIAKETNEVENGIVKNWLQESPDNQLYFNQLKILWDKSADVKAIEEEVDTDKAWNAVRSRVFKEEEPKVVELQPSTFNFKRVFQIAASLFIGLGILWVAYLQFQPTKMIEIATLEEVKEITLPDQSVVTLNQNSKLTYPADFAESSREVQLEGEAFFDVESMPKRPFIIKTSESFVQVLGTSFTVNTQDVNKTEVAVSEGKVMLYSNEQNKITPKENIQLTKGQKGYLNANTKALKKEENEDVNFFSWKTKQFVFEDTPLLEVFTLLEEAYQVEIAIDNNSLSQCTMYANFNQQPLEAILEVFEITYNLEVNRSTIQNIQILGGGCETVEEVK